MLDVDLQYFWTHGRIVFTGCFVPPGILLRYLLLSHESPRPIASRMVADLTMTTASWLFVVAVPLAIAAEQLVRVLILDPIPTGRADPWSWICVLTLSVIIAAASEITALRLFFKEKLRRNAVGFLFLIDSLCVAFGAYVAAEYVLSHPPM